MRTSINCIGIKSEFSSVVVGIDDENDIYIAQGGEGIHLTYSEAEELLVALDLVLSNGRDEEDIKVGGTD